jgi:protoporphyrin/coproporphyrin ferrochelatase
MTETRTAVLLMSYGTPRTPADILAYYTDIRRGSPPTDQQLADLTARYEAIGGISPLTERTDAQRQALQAALDAAADGQYHVALGMKHAAPFIEHAVGDLAASGFRRLVGLVLAPHYSTFSVGQYLDRMTAAAAPHEIEVCGIRSWATEPAFVDFVASEVRVMLAAMSGPTRVLFTAHSLPQRILTTNDPYPAELQATAEAVAAAAGVDNWGLAWQSAGRTPEPWLGPDILQVIDELAADGQTRAVLVSAVGFVADHLEVLYDLDIEASRRAEQHGLAFARTKCVNDDPNVMAALADRIIGAT